MVDETVRKFLINRHLRLSLLENQNLEQKELIATGDDVVKFDLLELFKINITQNVKKGKSIMIMSENCGNGKTSWATNILLEYFSQNLEYKFDKPIGIFINVADMLRELKFSMSMNKKPEKVEYIHEEITRVPLLVLDDIGYSKVTEFELQELTAIISIRNNAGLSTIYTTNCNRQDLATNLGERLASRIYDSSTCIEFFERSKRGM